MVKRLEQDADYQLLLTYNNFLGCPFCVTPFFITRFLPCFFVLTPLIKSFELPKVSDYLNITMKVISTILASFTIVICLVLIYFLSTTELFSDRLVGNKRLVMILILVVYVLFRFFKLYRIIKQKD